ncbi:MAG: AgmX/PglI C-terminal domain-containing protein [bacterium]|nr:AgmX/PglI C-terminal domain-containing protein [bacterium]MDT8366813.1 AgmX/PglI C-terminal domain-containing protein [bacterium]
MARNSLLIHLLRNDRTVTRSVVKGRNIYTGRDWKCQLLDPSSPVHRQKLLSRTMAGYTINLPISAAGTFIYQGSTIALEDMVAWGLAKKSKKGYQVHHREGMSADIRIGNATYILEYGPPIVPELALEPAKQGHLPFRYRFQTPNRTDLTFFTLLTLILVAHLAGVSALRKFPIPEITALKELPRRISRLILEPVAPPSPKIAIQGETGVGEGKPTAEVEKEPEPERVKPEAEIPTKGDIPAPANREVIRNQVSKMGILGVLTGRGTAGRKTAGAGISVLQLDSDLQQDLENVLGEIGGITTTASVAGTGGDAGFGGTGAGSGLIGIEGQLNDANVSGPIQVSNLGTAGGQPFGSLNGSNTGEAAAEEVIAPEQREERSTRTIARVVAAHTGAIRYAYNRELRKKTSLRGKIILTFTISPQGNVTECRIEESAMNWPPLENSLVKMIRTWKFPEIPEGDVTVSYPLVFFPSM